ncbi:TPA: glycosyltransferase family 4 protein [Morganella morganii]|nr:glycosyltransferase family 4 protein [Morganella morganii]
MMHNILLISINSISENTGGGIYLRSIVEFLKKNNLHITLFCKKNHLPPDDDEISISELKKNRFYDIVSRLFFIPTFYLPHVIKIVSASRKYDTIAFHNARFGLIIKLLRIIYPSKKIILFTDNFEYKLYHSRKNNFLTKLENKIIRFNESIALKNSFCVSFITKKDKKSLQLYYKTKKTNNLILPVIISERKIISEKAPNPSFCSLSKSKKIKIIFTASFDFFPNYSAGLEIINQAKKHSNLDFILAGRNASMFNKYIDEDSNIHIHENLSSEDMSWLMSHSDVYYSPVFEGSGMKTKVAEAMSYGLAILASKHSLIGYDDVKNKFNFILETSPDFFKVNLDKLISYNIDKSSIIKTYKLFYSPRRFHGHELNFIYDNAKKVKDE